MKILLSKQFGLCSILYIWKQFSDAKSFGNAYQNKEITITVTAGLLTKIQTKQCTSNRLNYSTPI